MGENVQTWCEGHGRESGTTYDVCAGCYARLEVDAHAFDQRLVPLNAGEPRGVEGWGGDVDHPPYAYASLRCGACGAPLTTLDDRRSLDCCSTEDAAIGCHMPRIGVTRRLLQ